MRFLTLTCCVLASSSSHVNSMLMERSGSVDSSSKGQYHNTDSGLVYDRVICDEVLPPAGLIPEPYTLFDFTSLTDLCALNERSGNVGCGCIPLIGPWSAEFTEVICSEPGPFSNPTLQQREDIRTYCEAYCSCKGELQVILPQMSGRITEMPGPQSGDELGDSDSTRSARTKAVLAYNQAIWRNQFIRPSWHQNSQSRRRSKRIHLSSCNIFSKDLEQNTCQCLAKTGRNVAMFRDFLSCPNLDHGSRRGD
jgi:hypothetical protein